MTYPSKKRQLILFEAHSRPAPEAETPAPQLRLDLSLCDLQTRWNTLEDHDESLAVRFAGGQEAQHAQMLAVTARGALR